MKSSGSIAGDSDCLFNYLSHSTLIQLRHGKHLDSETFDNVPFPRIYAPGADDCCVFWIQLRRETCYMRELLRAFSKKRSQRHTVNISGRACLWRVDICVRIQPDDSNLFILLLKVR